MKKYIAILPTLFFACLFFGLASCTKKQQPDNLYTRVMGQWKKTAYATDDNNNGMIDAQEIHPQSSSTIDELFFLGDTTGYEKITINNTQPEAPLNYKWYVNGDSLAVAYTAHYTVTYYIENVSSVNLTLYTNTSNGLAAYYYGK